MNWNIIGWFLVVACSAVGQTPAPAVRTTLLPVSIGGNVEHLYFRSGDKVLPFEAYQLGFGPGIDYSGSRRFVLHTSSAAFDVPPPGPVPKAFADLPPNADKVLVLCVPEEGGKLRLVPYDISRNGAKAGDYRIFNLSYHTLSVIIGEKKLVLKPAEDKTLSEQSWGTGVRDMKFQLATVSGTTATKVYSSIWGHQPAKRNFIFLVAGRTATMPIEILKFHDVPAADIPPAE